MQQRQSLFPPERLLIVSLESGLGWAEICPFLGQRITEVPYPCENNPKQFMRKTLAHIYQAFTTSAMTPLLVLTPTVGATVLYLAAATVSYGFLE